MNKKAVIYCRVSTSDRQNTERQVADLMEVAKKEKYEVLNVFSESVSGGAKNADRAVLQDCLSFCIKEKADILLCSELSRIGRSAFEVLATVKILIDNHIDLFLQKERFYLLDRTGKPSPFAAIMMATLSTCAELERENIQFRLNSGRKQYVAKGGKLGRKKGSIKTEAQKRKEYAQVFAYLKKGYSLRDTAKLTGVSLSTVQRLKALE